jgi:hypothetical protein
MFQNVCSYKHGHPATNSWKAKDSKTHSSWRTVGFSRILLCLIICLKLFVEIIRVTLWSHTLVINMDTFVRSVGYAVPPTLLGLKIECYVKEQIRDMLLCVCVCVCVCLFVQVFGCRQRQGMEIGRIVTLKGRATEKGGGGSPRKSNFYLMHVTYSNI